MHGLSELRPLSSSPPPLLHLHPEPQASLSVPDLRNLWGKRGASRAGLGSCGLETGPSETPRPASSGFWSQPSLSAMELQAPGAPARGVVQRTQLLAQRSERGLALMNWAWAAFQEQRWENATCWPRDPGWSSGHNRDQETGRFSKLLVFCSLFRTATSTHRQTEMPR